MARPKAFRFLTWGVFNNYIGRKKANLFSVIVDTNDGSIYPVPTDTEHIDWAAQILGCTRDDIRQDPSMASHLIPVVIETSPPPEELRRVVIGTCGMEIGYRVRHTAEQLERGRAMVMEFLEGGEVPLAKDLQPEVVKRWLAA